MPDVEIKRKTQLSRGEAGRRLIALGTALTEGAESQVDFEGGSIRFTVADRLDWEFELEVDGHETEVEIELKWSDAPAGEPRAQVASKSARTNSGTNKRAKATRGARS